VLKIKVAGKATELEWQTFGNVLRHLTETIRRTKGGFFPDIFGSSGLRVLET